MANVFTKQKDPVNHPKRNVFDLSFQNNLTMQIGGLYPVFCKEVIPGDSFSIKPVFGLRFMPMTFPIQTRMRANLHFFYVRNRNLWQDWQDFIGMNPTSPDENATMQRYVSPYSTNDGRNADFIVDTSIFGDFNVISSDDPGTRDYNHAFLHCLSVPTNQFIIVSTVIREITPITSTARQNITNGARPLPEVLTPKTIHYISAIGKLTS